MRWWEDSTHQNNAKCQGIRMEHQNILKGVNGKRYGEMCSETWLHHEMATTQYGCITCCTDGDANV